MAKEKQNTEKKMSYSKEDADGLSVNNDNAEGEALNEDWLRKNNHIKDDDK